MSSRLPGQPWAPRIAGLPTGVVDSTGRQLVLAAVGVLVVVLFALGALWALGTGTLAAGPQVAAVAALAVSLGAFAAVVVFSALTTE